MVGSCCSGMPYLAEYVPFFPPKILGNGRVSAFDLITDLRGAYECRGGNNKVKKKKKTLCP